jgi:glucose/mannose transport system permease protein
MAGKADLPGSRTSRARLSRMAIYGVLAILAVYFAAPVILMITTSFRPLDELRSGTMISLPHAWSFDSWMQAWSQACIGTRCSGLYPHFVNSLVVVIPSVAISTLLGAINGYALTMVRFRGAGAVFTLIWLGCFIPYQSVVIPAAQVLGFLNLAGSLWGLILVYTVYGIPFTTLFFRNYYVGVPDELVKSATIDGAGFFRTFIHIILPLSPPIIIVTIIFQFTQIWNEFLFGVSFTTGANQTLTVALNNLVNTTFGVKQYNVDMAAAMIATIPTLLVYVFAGRFFMRGLTAGSVKG